MVTFSVEVKYNNDMASRYLHVDLLRTADTLWINVAYARSVLLSSGTGCVRLSLTTNGLPTDNQYVWSVWTASEVDEAAERPWEYKKAWQLYEAKVGQSHVGL